MLLDLSSSHAVIVANWRYVIFERLNVLLSRACAVAHSFVFTLQYGAEQDVWTKTGQISARGRWGFLHDRLGGMY